MTDNAPQLKQYPPTITIPTPMHTPRLRGTHAARGPYALGPLAANLRVRVASVDCEIIDRVCARLGMNRAEYARWCAVEVAKQLDNM